MNTEEFLDETRKLVADAEKHPESLFQAYVAKHEEPCPALRKIRSLLYATITPEDRLTALAVVYLDRVIDSLDGFRMRTVYEKRT